MLSSTSKYRARPLTAQYALVRSPHALTDFEAIGLGTNRFDRPRQVEVGAILEAALARRAEAGADGYFRLDTFYRELGVGAGLGLRLAWEFLVVRFDLATRLHDPAPHEREGVVLQPHFGIGHTF